MLRFLTGCAAVLLVCLQTAAQDERKGGPREDVRRIERGSDSFFLRVTARMLLNPARSCANILRLRWLWHRETR